MSFRPRQRCLEEGSPRAEALEAALLAASCFRWLDQDKRWFTVGDTNKCAAAHRVRKMMCVVQEAIGADQIAAGFVTDDRRMYRDLKRP